VAAWRGREPRPPSFEPPGETALAGAAALLQVRRRERQLGGAIIDPARNHAHYGGK
jgi:hypothetical protein